MSLLLRFYNNLVFRLYRLQLPALGRRCLVHSETEIAVKYPTHFQAASPAVPLNDLQHVGENSSRVLEATGSGL